MSYTPDIALAVPHTPWIPARAESMLRLATQLDVDGLKVFQDREPNWSWSEKLWRWGAETGKPYLLQLQDDVIVGPGFWDALRAMLKACPGDIIGLQGAHPTFRELAREGSRWAHSRAWMVGVGYVIPHDSLVALLQWRAKLPGHLVQSTNEDDLIARFCVETGRRVMHPIPTIIDHDTDIESTYGNGNHAHRRPTVTWREYGRIELGRESFWRVPEVVPLVSNPHAHSCWFCHSEPGAVASAATGARIGRQCMANTVGTLLGVQR